MRSLAGQAAVFKSGNQSSAPNQQKIRRVVLGDMRHFISILRRDIQPLSNVNTSVDFGESFVMAYERYAAIKTLRGDQMFDGTNLISAYTHIFYIRSISGLGEEKWIEYADQYFDIIDVENYDERGLFMQLKCNLRGDKLKVVNYA